MFLRLVTVPINISHHPRTTKKIELVSRLERCHGNSETSGQYVVEDVSVNGEWFRRLIFLHNAGIVQSEAKLKLAKGGKKRVLDLNYLCQQYHTYMTGAMGAKPKANVLIIGLGGGVLPSYIVAKFPKVRSYCLGLVFLF